MFERLRENASLLMLIMLAIMSIILLGLVIIGQMDLRAALSVILLPLILYGLIALVTLLLRNR